jgi:hypothetical protein
MRNHLRHYFRQRRPPDWRDRVDQLVFHQVDRLAKQEDLDLVARFREGIRVQESKSRFCWIVRAPRALNQDLYLTFPNSGGYDDQDHTCRQHYKADANKPEGYVRQGGKLAESRPLVIQYPDTDRSRPTRRYRQPQH